MLRKWYLDCVTEEGELCIGYAARLKWRRADLRYSSVLHRDQAGRVGVSSSLRGTSLPEQVDDAIHWNAPELKLSGSWLRRSPAIAETLCTMDDGTLQWECLQPRAEVSVNLGGKILNGLGYVETIDLSIPPWKLPLETLRWGRFASADESIVWIRWDGELPKTLLFRNGARCAGAVVADHEVSSLDGVLLALCSSCVLRSGPLRSGALSIIPRLTNLFPRSVLDVSESKWLSKGALTLYGVPASAGWAIHEEVKFR